MDYYIESDGFENSYIFKDVDLGCNRGLIVCALRNGKKRFCSIEGIRIDIIKKRLRKLKLEEIVIFKLKGIL